MCMWCAGRKRRKKCHWNGNCRRNRAEFLPRRALHVSNTPITWIRMAVMNHRGDHGPLMEPRNRCESWASLGTILHSQSGECANSVWNDKWEKNREWHKENEKLAVVFQQVADWRVFMMNRYNWVHVNTYPVSSCVCQTSLCVQTMLSVVQWRSWYPEMLFHGDISLLCRTTLSYLGQCSKISVGGRQLVMCWFNTHLSPAFTQHELCIYSTQ